MALAFRLVSRNSQLQNDVKLCGYRLLFVADNKVSFSTGKCVFPTHDRSGRFESKRWLLSSKSTQQNRVLPQINTPEYEDQIADFPQNLTAVNFKGLESSFPCVSKKYACSLSLSLSLSDPAITSLILVTVSCDWPHVFLFIFRVHPLKMLFILKELVELFFFSFQDQSRVIQSSLKSQLKLHLFRTAFL